MIYKKQKEGWQWKEPSKSKKTLDMQIGRGQSSRIEEKGNSKGKRNMYDYLLYARHFRKCWSVSSSQQLYEIGSIIIILPIWQMRKHIQINTANKGRAQNLNPQVIWLLSSMISHLQLRLYNRCSGKFWKRTFYIIVQLVISTIGEVLTFLEVSWEALKVSGTLEDFGKWNREFPLIPLKSRVCGFMDTIRQK